MTKYSELVKNIDHAIEYIRQFYVFGYRTRNDFQQKSTRSYDTQSRRIRGWMGNHVLEQRNTNGKNISLYIDSSEQPRNPLYAIWECKSFTRNDILLHFFLLNVLADGRTCSVEEIADEIHASYDMLFDLSTLRNKLREYTKEGLFLSSKRNRQMVYQISSLHHHMLMSNPLRQALSFFTEIAPLGEIGSYIQNEIGHENTLFRFKHDYIVHTLEDKTLLSLLQAIHTQCKVALLYRRQKPYYCTPLKILVSAQGGRRYLCSINQQGKIKAHRLDRIEIVNVLAPDANYEDKQKQVEAYLPFVWGASIRDRLDTVVLRIHIDLPQEEFILHRIVREGRCGTLEQESAHIFRYCATVSDASEMIPFIRSFTGRIVSLESSDRQMVLRFHNDLQRSFSHYGL